MHTFTPDVSATPATGGAASPARSFLNSFLQRPIGARTPAQSAAIAAKAPAPITTVPNLASGTRFMAWLS